MDKSDENFVQHCLSGKVRGLLCEWWSEWWKWYEKKRK